MTPPAKLSLREQAAMLVERFHNMEAMVAATERGEVLRMLMQSCGMSAQLIELAFEIERLWRLDVGGDNQATAQARRGLFRNLELLRERAANAEAALMEALE